MVALNCPLCCNQTFTTSSSLKDHLLAISDKLLCPICNTKFTNLEELCKHLDNDCNEVEDEPEVNSDSILAKALLEGKKEFKIEVENSSQEYYCQTCDVDFTDMTEHLSNFHVGQEIILEEEPAPRVTAADILLVVDSSEKTDTDVPKPTTTEDITDNNGRLYTRKFVKIDKFWLESQSDESKNPGEETVIINPDENQEFKTLYKCEVCNTAFPTFKSLRLHRRMHDPVKSRAIESESGESIREMFICHICHKPYGQEYKEVHMKSHENIDTNTCEICNRKFHTKSNLEMHIKAHSSNKKFACSYCKKSFVTYDALNDHLSNQCQKRAFACQYCGRRFSRPHEKVKHERIHTGEKPHVCEICGKAFRVSYCLTLHLRTHSGLRPYECKHCGKRFKSNSVYNHHLMTHSDVRSYKCPFCPKAFKTSVQLAGHKNSHIKPFTCTQCNRPFASLYAVRAHMETHKRDNNLKYECWLCGALYSRAFALRDHIKFQHHQTEENEKRNEVDEEMEAANSILVNDEDIILGLEEAANIEVIENEGE